VIDGARRILSAAALLLTLIDCATPAMLNDWSDGARIARNSDPVSLRRSAGGQLEMDVILEGRSVPCIVDTGAPMSALPDIEAFRELPSRGRVWFWGVSGEKIAAFRVAARDLRIGGVPVPDAVFTLSPALSDRCLLGLDILSRGVLSLNFDRWQLYFLSQMPTGVAEHPLILHPTGHFAVPLRVGDAEARSVFDTGAGQTLVSTDWAAAHPEALEPSLFGDHMQDAVSDQTVALAVYRTRAPLRLGTRKLEGRRIGSARLSLAANLNFDFLVGMDFIGQSNWLIDVGRRRWANF
jgi:predicted aspartyl protease